MSNPLHNSPLPSMFDLLALVKVTAEGGSLELAAQAAGCSLAVAQKVAGSDAFKAKVVVARRLAAGESPNGG